MLLYFQVGPDVEGFISSVANAKKKLLFLVHESLHEHLVLIEQDLGDFYKKSAFFRNA